MKYMVSGIIGLEVQCVQDLCFCTSNHNYQGVVICSSIKYLLLRTFEYEMNIEENLKFRNKSNKVSNILDFCLSFQT